MWNYVWIDLFTAHFLGRRCQNLCPIVVHSLMLLGATFPSIYLSVEVSQIKISIWEF